MKIGHLLFEFGLEREMEILHTHLSLKIQGEEKVLRRELAMDELTRYQSPSLHSPSLVHSGEPNYFSPLH